MKKITIISGIVLITLVISGFLFVNKTFASFISSDKFVNRFADGDVNVEINENFKEPEGWKGEKYPKEVSVKNLSKDDSLIRVSIVPRWVDEKGEPWPGDTSFVQISFINVGSKWLKDNESDYYYYNEIVPKDKSSEKIIESVSANIPENLKSRYKGKTLVVDVKSESVQASKEAYSKVWSDIKNNSIKDSLNGICKY